MNALSERAPRLVPQCMIRLFLLLASASLIAITASATKPASLTITPPSLFFEQNHGQFADSVDYAARGQGYSVLLGPLPTVELFRYKTHDRFSRIPDHVALQPQAEVESAASLRLLLANANPDAKASPQQRHDSKTHYLKGPKPNWRTDVSSYARVRYSDILPQIDIEYYGKDGRLEYDFIVRPLGDPSSIQLQFKGADTVRINDNGDLVLDLGDTEIVQYAPLSYQLDADGHRQIVASEYTLDGDTVGFRLAQWDRSRPLIIDPVLEYARYFGGSRLDRPYAAEIDAAGNIYIIGETRSSGLGTVGAYGEMLSTERVEVESFPFCDECTDGPGQVSRVSVTTPADIFVTKFSPDGQNILWTTYFGTVSAANVTLGVGSAGVSDAGEVAFGITSAPDGLPLLNATQSWAAAQSNGYVAKLNSAGNGLVFGTYLNLGTFFSWIRGLDVSPAGEVAVAGLLGEDSTMPVVTGIPGQSCTFNVAENELSDGYLALFDASGVLTFSSCLGGDIRDGSSFEGLRGITIGANGDLYAVGYSSMIDFPVVNAIQATKNVPFGREMTISQVDPDTGALLFSTWFGPADGTIAPEELGGFFAYFPYGIEVDSGGNIVVSGSLNLLTFPAVNAFQPNLGVPRDTSEFRFNQSDTGVFDVFVTKLHPTNGVIFSTYLGGSQAEGGIPSLALDADDNVYVQVVTTSDDYPVLNPIQATKTGDASMAVSKLTPQGALAFSTYLGGSDDRILQLPGGLVVNPAGDIVLASWSRSLDFPTVGSGTSNAGRYDVTLAIIDQSADADADGDGVPDAVDAFPGNASEWRDTDGDLTGDNADTDDDGDGVPDATDGFPKIGSESADADADGAGDNLDEFDADPTNYFDLDGDGVADFLDDDADGDGVPAANDQFAYDASETEDTDGDGIGDNADTDDDGDGLADGQDLDPLDSQSPIQGFEGYNPFNVAVYLSPWPDNFSAGPNAEVAWTAADDEVYRGNTSLGSRIIDHGQSAAIAYTDTFAGGALSFWYKVDSQSGADIFTFSIDGNVVLTASGDTGWQQFQSPIAAGTQSLVWRYAKDGSVSEGTDAAWIDDLVFDRDGDGFTDDLDNCTLAANPQQQDTDGDGYGNACDADFNNDCVVTVTDLGQFRSVFFTTDPDADFNGDGIVNPIDLGILRSLFFQPPGPSAAGPCGVP